MCFLFWKLAIWINFLNSTVHVFYVLFLCVHYSGINRVLNWLDYRRTLIKRLPSVLFMEAQRLHRRPTMFWFYRQGGYLQGLPKSIYRSGSNNYIIIKVLVLLVLSSFIELSVSELKTLSICFTRTWKM